MLTTSFRKIVKNTRQNVEKEDTDKFIMNNTIQVVAIVKRITLKD